MGSDDPSRIPPQKDPPSEIDGFALRPPKRSMCRNHTPVGISVADPQQCSGH
jgi:hypothetical protein